MKIEFAVPKGEESYLFSVNGQEIDMFDNLAIGHLQSKYDCKIVKIRGNYFYKFDVISNSDSVDLVVYEGIIVNNRSSWTETYRASARLGQPGVVETGDFDLAFWHDLLSTVNNSKNELFVDLYCLSDNHMDIVRNIFNHSFEGNVFLFMEKYKSIKKTSIKVFDKDIFNIPQVRINKNVGKAKEGEYAYHAIQREIELKGEVFFDVTVIEGPVKNGVMDIVDKHRYFLTEGYAYSPDGGSLEIFMNPNLCGPIYCNNMEKRYPSLMLDKYKNGRYFYQYFFSRDFIPCFEILAKAGYTFLADMFLDEYYDLLSRNRQDIYFFSDINLYGKNDKEIFGFKLNKLRNINESGYIDYYTSYGHQVSYHFSNFIERVKSINKYAPCLFDIKDIGFELLRFMRTRCQDENCMKEVLYIQKMGVSNTDLYDDYLRMCKNANKYYDGMYPKNIKLAHDVMVTYMNQLKEAKNNEYFKSAVSSPEYLDYLYEEEEYSIFAPRTANDLVNESYQLSHCVRSYIDRVASGSTKIYFLRLNESKSKSLVTIEVFNKQVYQARGKYNRDVTSKEREFIKRWADKKHLAY